MLSLGRRSVLTSHYFCVLQTCPPEKDCVVAVTDCREGDTSCTPRFEAHCVDPGKFIHCDTHVHYSAK